MSKMHALRVFVKESLIAAVDEIFEVVERTITEYQQQGEVGSLSLQPECHQPGKPDTELHEADLQLLPHTICKEEGPSELLQCAQNWSHSLVPEDPEPPNIKRHTQEPTKPSTISMGSLIPASLKSLSLSQISQSQSEEGRDEESPHSSSAVLIKTELDKSLCDAAEAVNAWVHLTSDSSVTQNEGRPDPGEETVRGIQSLSGPCYSTAQTSSGTENTLHQCKFCEKMFSRRAYYKVHMRCHTGERPFTCNFCGKGFIHRPDLKRHIRIHTGEKPYSCPHCRKGFSQSGTLKRHMKIHAAEPMFVWKV